MTARLFTDEDSLPFGKHKGKAIATLIDTDPSWLLWYMENGNPGNIRDWCIANEAEIREAAKSGKKRDFKPVTSKTSFSTPEVTNIYYKMFSSAFTLLNPGAQLALKDYWRDKGVEIKGINEETLQVNVNAGKPIIKDEDVF